MFSFKTWKIALKLANTANNFCEIPNMRLKYLKGAFYLKFAFVRLKSGQKTKRSPNFVI